LIQSSGGVFEINDGSNLIFSKKSLGRFPEDGEILGIIKGMKDGLSLNDAQDQAAKGVKQPPGFIDWMKSVLKKSS